jgi:hypothetical protein
MSRMTPTAARSHKATALEDGQLLERRRGRERRGQGDELAARLTEAFLADRRVIERRRAPS